MTWCWWLRYILTRMLIVQNIYHCFLFVVCFLLFFCIFCLFVVVFSSFFCFVLFQICAAIYQLLLHMVFTSRNWFVMQGPVAIILISWNVIFIWETGYWIRAIKRFALFDLLKSLYSDTNICRNIFCPCRNDYKRCIVI